MGAPGPTARALGCLMKHPQHVRQSDYSPTRALMQGMFSAPAIDQRPRLPVPRLEGAPQTVEGLAARPVVNQIAVDPQQRAAIAQVADDMRSQILSISVFATRWPAEMVDFPMEVCAKFL